MKTIETLAKELGEAIKVDPRMVKLNEAKAVYEANVELGRAAIEFEVQQRALANEYAKPEKDEVLIASVQKRAEELYEMIVASEDYKALAAAEEEVNALMNEVNQTITMTITGVDPSCTHDCSTCSGCH